MNIDTCFRYIHGFKTSRPTTERPKPPSSKPLQDRASRTKGEFDCKVEISMAGHGDNWTTKLEHALFLNGFLGEFCIIINLGGRFPQFRGKVLFHDMERKKLRLLNRKLQMITTTVEQALHRGWKMRAQRAAAIDQTHSPIFSTDTLHASSGRAEACHGRYGWWVLELLPHVPATADIVIGSSITSVPWRHRHVTRWFPLLVGQRKWKRIHGM